MMRFPQEWGTVFSGGTARIYHYVTGQHLTVLHRSGGFNSVTVAPDRSWLATIAFGEPALIWIRHRSAARGPG